MIQKWNPKQLCLAILPSALAVGSTLVSASPSLALTGFTWDVNLSDNGYSATGYIVTDTSTPSANLGSSDILDWNFTLTNGTATDTLTSSNSNLSYGNGLNINSAGNALVLPQVGTYTSITFNSSVNSSTLYFGYPYNTGSTPNLGITIVNTSTSNSGNYYGDTYSSTTFATGPTTVPFDVPGGATIPAVGGLLALGLMRKARKRIASNTHIPNLVCTSVR